MAINDQRLLRCLAANLAIGVAAALIFVAGVFLLDIASLRTLSANSPDGLLAVIALTILTIITFGSAAMGTGIFLLPKDDAPRRPTRGGLRPLIAPAPVPVRRKPAR